MSICPELSASYLWKICSTDALLAFSSAAIRCSSLAR